MMNNRYFKALGSLSFWSCLMMACMIGSVHTAHASGQIAPQPCDPKYWDTMSARAWMEAEREIMQNQNLIFKPDSVLQYTCFDNMVSHGAKYLGDIFVHTDYFGKVIIERKAAQAQEKALQNVVTASLTNYLNGNYPSVFLANRADRLRNKPATTSRTPDGGDYKQAEDMAPYSNCNIMAEVWKASKCINFVDNDAFKGSDSFYPFRTLKPGPGDSVTIPGYDTIGDVRYWPQLCADPVKGDEWVKKDEVATNQNENTGYKFKTPLETDFKDVRKMVEPGACSLNSSGIETGITIIVSGAGGSRGEDKVCTNPGCTYVDGSCQ